MVGDSGPPLGYFEHASHGVKTFVEHGLVLGFLLGLVVDALNDYHFGVYLLLKVIIVFHAGFYYFVHLKKFFLHGLDVLVILELHHPHLQDLLLQFFNILLAGISHAVAIRDRS